MKILVTGFEPFGNDPQNGSGEAVLGLEREWASPSLPEVRSLKERGDLDLVTRILPVAFGTTARELRALLETEQPDAVLCLGEAGGRSEITPETTAKNLMDARIPDNEGEQPKGEVILESAGAAIHSILNAESLTVALRSAGLPAKTSDDAGLFVCNSTFFHALNWALTEQLEEAGDVKGHLPLAGFVHVPAVRSTGTATVGAETDAGNAERTGTDTQPDAVTPAPDAAGRLTFEHLTRAAAVLVAEAARQIAEGTPVLVQKKGGA